LWSIGSRRHLLKTRRETLAPLSAFSGFIFKLTFPSPRNQPFDPHEIGFEFSTAYPLNFNDEEWKRIHIREGNYYTWLKQQKQRKAA
jgi:hypothetical protein